MTWRKNCWFSAFSRDRVELQAVKLVQERAQTNSPQLCTKLLNCGSTWQLNYEKSDRSSPAEIVEIFFFCLCLYFSRSFKALIWNGKYRHFVSSIRKDIYRMKSWNSCFSVNKRTKLVVEEFNSPFRNLGSQRYTWKKPTFICIYSDTSPVYESKLKPAHRELSAHIGASSFIFSLNLYRLLFCDHTSFFSTWIKKKKIIAFLIHVLDWKQSLKF